MRWIWILLPLFYSHVFLPHEVGYAQIYLLVLFLSPWLTFTSGAEYLVDQAEEADSIHPIWSVSVLFALAFSVLLVILRKSLLTWVTWPGEIIDLLIIGVPANILSNLGEKIWLRTQDSRLLSYLNTLGAGLVLVSIPALMSAYSVLWLVTVLLVIKAAVLTLVLVQKGEVQLRFDTAQSRTHLQAFFTYGAYGFLALFLSYSDQLAMALFQPAHVFAGYALAGIVASLFYRVTEQLHAKVLPEVDKIFADGRIADGVSVYCSALRPLIYQYIPLMAFVSVFSPWVTHVVLGDKFAEAGSLLGILVWVGIARWFAFDWIARARHETAWLLSVSTVGAVLFFLLSAVLVKDYGPLGVALGAVVFQAALVVYSLVYFSKELSLNLEELFPLRDLLRVGVAAIVVCIFIRWVLFRFSVALVWFSPILFAGIYPLVLLLLTKWWRGVEGSALVVLEESEIKDCVLSRIKSFGQREYVWYTANRPTRTWNRLLVFIFFHQERLPTT